MIGTQEAAKRIGVAPVTLKRWLLQGKVSDVRRNRNGWRVFSETDLERIRQYAQLEVSAGQSRRLTAVSLFSGIGGFDIGFERAGFDVTLQCEVNKFCLHLLEKHWPDVPRFSDIRELKSEDIPKADVWIGGFPCQDVSLARMGPRDGLRGKQSGLFYEFARLIRESRPRVFVLENVAGLLSSHGGRDFGAVLSTLAELGYAIGWRTLNSKNFGVPQSRQRVYVVGCYRDRRGPGAILFEPERGEGDASQGGDDGANALSPFKRVIAPAGEEGPVTQAMAYCLYACSARHTGTDWSRTYVSYPKRGKVRRLTPKECEGVMAFPQGWTIPKSATFEDVDTLRYHALGNAVTPPVAEWLGKRVAAYLRSSALEESGVEHVNVLG